MHTLHTQIHMVFFMARMSIAAAARSVDMSRSNFYKNYINKGKISVSRDKQNRPYIETSELIRVFDSFVAPSDGRQTKGQGETSAEKDKEIEYLKQLLAEKDKQIQSAEDREKRLLGEVERFQLLLDHKREEEPKNSKKRGFLGRVVAAALEID